MKHRTSKSPPFLAPARVAALTSLCALSLALSGCAGGSAKGGCSTTKDCGDGLLCVNDNCQAPARPDAGKLDAQPSLEDAIVVRSDTGPTPDAAAMDAAVGGDVALTPDQSVVADGAVPVDGPVSAPPDAAVPPPPPDAAPPLPDMDMGPCNPGEVRDCGRTLGHCRAGRQQCQADGSWGACAGEVPPEAEICNGQDDDCNGVVDDGFNIGQPCEGVGACGPGVLECRSNIATRCSTDPGGSRHGDVPETCDGTDEDCDGRIDEDFMVGIVCPGRCGPGHLECGPARDLICDTDVGGSRYVVSDEICDGRDNNGAGTVADGFNLGAPCEGVGRCGAGVFECDADGSGRAVCSSEPGGSGSEAVAEQCNAQDDDCDGQTDEDFATGQPCDGAGACGAGVSECAADGRLICSTEPGGSHAQGGPELCNGVDDNCDGQIDEGLGLGNACPAQGICPAGVVECDATGHTICSTGPGGTADVSAAESCNTLDDDCDGQTDEDFSVGMPCDGQGACGNGVRECDGHGGARCSTEPGGSQDQSVAERCDGQDNDCNGAVDDGAACGGDTCGTAPGLVLDTSVEGSTGALINDYSNTNCIGQTPGNDQVFRFDTPAQNRFAVGVVPLQAGYDTLFWVTSDCANVGTCVQGGGRDANGAGRPEARVVDSLRAGTFYVVVDGRIANQGGPFSLTVAPFADGESCVNPVTLPLPGHFTGTTEGRTNEVAAANCPVGGATVGPDQVFALTPDHNGRLTVNLTAGPALRFALSLSTNCAQPDNACLASALAAQNSQSISVAADVVAGTTYYLTVDHLGGGGGAFALETAIQ